ncbi:MAG: futalosine hydrolase [Prevotellaceae bacterium]|jgi:futalosine hydrolase|nr:futalosine hydrolase [Prevotellaceae bacterium]
MNILITAATAFELQEIKEKVKSVQNHNIDFCVTGIGCTLTAYKLAKKLQDTKFDLVLNVGFAGSFVKNTEIGTTVIVENEIFGNLGIAYPHKLSTLFDENFMNKNEYPFTNGKLFCKYANLLNSINLKLVCGLTVDVAGGEQNQIEQRQKMFNADIETMEGAAFFYVCLSEKIPFLEIRTISNYIEPRNKNKWNIPLATRNLTNNTFNFLNSLQLKQIKINKR